MPIYEYECGDCGQIHEIMQKMSDQPLSECPRCSGKLQKLISHSTFHLKGSGWYATDYANRNSGSPAAESKTPDKTGEKSPSTSEKPPSTTESSSADS